MISSGKLESIHFKWAHILRLYLGPDLWINIMLVDELFGVKDPAVLLDVLFLGLVRIEQRVDATYSVSGNNDFTDRLMSWGLTHLWTDRSLYRHHCHLPMNLAWCYSRCRRPHHHLWSRNQAGSFSSGISVRSTLAYFEKLISVNGIHMLRKGLPLKGFLPV